MNSEIDNVTKRPRTPNDQYTCLTVEQIKNIKKNTSPFFHTIDRSKTLPPSAKQPREGGRYYLDRYCSVTNEHLLRGTSKTQPFGWIDSKWNHLPPEEYNTCRGRAAARWGPNKSGERTRSHTVGESVDRYTTIDMYRRPPTNYEGRVVMDHGRPCDGYYSQRYPSRTTWFGSAIPLNRTNVLESVQRKTAAEYEQIKGAEQLARSARIGDWPEFSEYTEKYVLRTKTAPILTGLQERKKLLETCY